MTDPGPVDSQGRIYFNIGGQKPQGEMIILDRDDLPARGDVGVNTSFLAAPPENRNAEIDQALADITTVLHGLTKGMQSMKQTMETQNTARVDANQNNTGEMPPACSPEVGGMRPCPVVRPVVNSKAYVDHHGNPDIIDQNPRYNRPHDPDHYQVPTVRGQIRPNIRPRQSNDGFHIKIPPFTGKEEWPVWIARFETIAQRFGWSEEDKLDQLLPRMEGQAGQFVFAQLPPRTLRDYQELLCELHSRFRVIETARSFAAKFSERSQRSNETAEEYAADLKVLYDKAHGYRDKHTREEDLVRRFLDGLRDDEVRFEVEYHKEPGTLDEAVYHVVTLIQTRNIRERKNRDHARRAADSDDSDYEPELLYRVQANKPKENPADEKKTEPAIGSGVQQVTDLLHQLVQMVQKLEGNQGQATEGDRSKVKRDKRNVECFNCHKMGHYARECPGRQNLQRNFNWQDKGPRNGAGEQNPLNFNGPALMARGRPN